MSNDLAFGCDVRGGLTDLHCGASAWSKHCVHVVLRCLLPSSLSPKHLNRKTERYRRNHWNFFFLFYFHVFPCPPFTALLLRCREAGDPWIFFPTCQKKASLYSPAYAQYLSIFYLFILG